MESRAGKTILNGLYYVGTSLDMDTFNSLPNAYVLKATHSSGMNLICRDKSQLSFDEVTSLVDKWLAVDYYKTRREWAYKCVSPRIICEALLLDENDSIPEDYKIFCFNGTPEFIQVDYDRFGGHKRNFYTTEWKTIPCNYIYDESTEMHRPPEKLGEMLVIAQKLSRGFPFTRIDLFLIKDIIYFGEVTLYPESASAMFTPHSYEVDFGSKINIDDISTFD